MPSKNTFKSISFDYNTLEKRFRELSFLNKGTNIIIKDIRSNKINKFYYEGGIKSFLRYINKNKIVINEDPIIIQEKKDNIHIEIALEWTSGYNESFLCFTNSIPQKDGGTHLSSFRSALTRVINNYINQNSIQRKSKNI